MFFLCATKIEDDDVLVFVSSVLRTTKTVTSPSSFLFFETRGKHNDVLVFVFLSLRYEEGNRSYRTLRVLSVLPKLNDDILVVALFRVERTVVEEILVFVLCLFSEKQ